MPADNSTATGLMSMLVASVAGSRAVGVCSARARLCSSSDLMDKRVSESDAKGCQKRTILV